MKCKNLRYRSQPKRLQRFRNADQKSLPGEPTWLPPLMLMALISAKPAMAGPLVTLMNHLAVLTESKYLFLGT
jgi:hypothetical protein